jgi:mRNA interferase MazF
MSPTSPAPYSVCLARFRFLESEQQKIRPVIAVGRPYGERRILMAIPVTSSAKAESVDVMIENWQVSGLLKPSVARTHRLSAILEEDLLEQIGTIDDKHQAAIKAALKNLLGLK